jgi:[acyl-carrier-protein] S-malonyltransferase
MKKLAFLFPGQGSQSVGMLDAWADHPSVKQTLAEASDALNQDLGQLISTGTKEDLSLTTNTQPVMLVAGVAAYRVWRAEGGADPQVMAGHSLGEYSALVCAGVLSLKDAAPLVRFRAQSMQDAVPVGVGAMAAILGLASDKVIEGCAQASSELPQESVQAVNFNDPMQTVIAGTVGGVNKACEILKSMGAKRALILPVSAPFHSNLMQPAAEKLKEKLSQTTFAVPLIPVINNVDVLSPSEPSSIKDSLYRQAFKPVRWVEIIREMKNQGVELTVESGPGKVLFGLTTRIDPTLESAALYDPTTLSKLQELLSSSAA